jgi:creatinine amidohydrolase
MRHWILSETNYGHLKEHPVEVAVIAMGATEPHNLHLPYGTDAFEGTELASRACEAAYKRGAKVVMLPTMPYGTQTNMAAFPLAMNLHPTTLLAIIRDLCGSLALAKVPKLLIVNSHGGNDFKWVLRELANQTPVKLFLCDWFRGLTDDAAKGIFQHPDDHAGEMETSLGLAFFPDLVARKPDGSLAADDGATRKTRFDAINKGWISISRPWHLLTTNTGSGYPHAASAEKGRKLMDGLTSRLADFLVELSNAPVDEKFPF